MAEAAIPAAVAYFVADTLVDTFAHDLHEQAPHPHVPPNLIAHERAPHEHHPNLPHLFANQGGPLGPGHLRPPQMPPIDVPPPPGPWPERHEVQQAEDAVADAIAGATGMAVGTIIGAPLGPLAPVVGAALGAGIVALGHLIRGR